MAAHVPAEAINNIHACRICFHRARTTPLKSPDKYVRFPCTTKGVVNMARNCTVIEHSVTGLG